MKILFLILNDYIRRCDFLFYIRHTKYFGSYGNIQCYDVCLYDNIRGHDSRFYSKLFDSSVSCDTVTDDNISDFSKIY